MHENTPLGKDSHYVERYTPGLLCPISRHAGRQALGIKSGQALPFQGVDVWTAFELSWLNLKGKPLAAVAEFIFPAQSPCIVESKSLKLYLNSFNQTRFDSLAVVQEQIKNDLCRIVETPDIEVRLTLAADYLIASSGGGRGQSLDDLDIEVSQYHPDSGLLAQTSNTVVDEKIYSDVFRSTCPVTSQPDWASIEIVYSGREIDQASLLKYLVSYRRHQGFHEQCIEQIFCDLSATCEPEKLLVNGRFLRRGGIDINPCRSSHPVFSTCARTSRQ